MKYCQQCGNQCNVEMKFCPKCGVKLIEMEEQKLQQDQETKANEKEVVIEETIQNTQSQEIKEESFQPISDNSVENKDTQSSGVVIETPTQTENKTENSWNNNQDTQNNQNDTKQTGTWNYGSTNNTPNGINNNIKPQKKKLGFGIASLILSILSGIYGFIVLFIVLFNGMSGLYAISIILAIISVVLGVLGMKDSKPFCIAGIIISGIVILSSIFMIIINETVGSFSDIFDDFYYNQQYDDDYDYHIDDDYFR